MPNQTQFYKSALFVGDSPVPVFPNASFDLDDNFDFPPIIGNYGQFNYGDGARSPVVNMSFATRDRVGEVLSSTFLNYALTRSNDQAHDTSAITGATYNGIGFWDGNDGWTMTTPKMDSFSIGAQGGGPISMSARFCGCGASSIGSTPTYPGFDASKILRFNAVSVALGGGNTAKVYGFNLSYSNNSTPQMRLNGSIYPVAWNAGVWSASLEVMLGAEDTQPIQDTDVVITINGSSSKALVLTCHNPTWNNLASRTTNAPRVTRSYRAILKPASAQTCPVTITSNF